MTPWGGMLKHLQSKEQQLVCEVVLITNTRAGLRVTKLSLV